MVKQLLGPFAVNYIEEDWSNVFNPIPLFYFLLMESLPHRIHRQSPQKTGCETTALGLYWPAWREDSNPTVDEAKLQFFTRPLPGYEAGRQVPVNVTITGGAHERKSTLLSPLSELRFTTSDVPLRKTKSDNSETGGIMASDQAMSVPFTSRKLSDAMTLGNSYSHVKIPRSSTTNDFGVIGDGRSQASSQQQNRRLVQIQATPKRQPNSQMPASLESLAHPNLQASPNSKAADTDGDEELSDSKCEGLGTPSASAPEAIAPVRPSRSYSSSNPWASNNTDTVFLGRVSRPIDPLTSSSVNQIPEKNYKEMISQPKPPPARILNPSVPDIWRRGGSPFTALHENRNQENSISDGLLGSRFDPETFALPSGVR